MSISMTLGARFGLLAGLDDVRIHDLRHSYASVAVSGGMGLPQIGKLLGHSQTQTTHRYAHFADAPIKSAAETVSGKMAHLLGNFESSKKDNPHLLRKTPRSQN